MLKNKFVIGVILYIAALSCLYGKLALPFSKDTFRQNKRVVCLENGAANVNLDLKKDAYSLRLSYLSAKNQEKEFFLNGLKITPVSVGARGPNEVICIYIPQKIVQNGPNLLTVKFLKNSPEKFTLKTGNYYYKMGNVLYALSPDSAALTGGKGVSISGRYKIIISELFFWCLLLGGCCALFLFYFFKNKAPGAAFYSLPFSCKNRRIEYIGKIILWGFVLSVLFHLVKSIIHGFHYPNDTFLLIPSNRFFDFYNPYEACKGLNPYFTTFIYRSNYYPFLNILVFLFTLLPKMVSLLLFNFIFILFFLRVNVSNLGDAGRGKFIKNTLIFTFLTYPFLFCLDRANYENIVFIFLYLFVYFYYRKKFIISSIFLSFAAAMKVFPAIFLILFLSDKKYKETIFTIVFIAALTVLSLMFHRGGFFPNLHFMLSGFGVNETAFLCGNNVVQRGVSLFTLAKIYFIQTNQIASVDMARFLGAYIKTALILLIPFFGYVLFIEKEPWKKVMILFSAALLMPQLSADYKLIHLFIPMFMFINSDKESRFDLFYMVMFGLLLIPKDYYLFPKIMSDSGCSDISIAVVLNILIIIVMAVVIAVDGFLKQRGGISSKPAEGSLSL